MATPPDGREGRAYVLRDDTDWIWDSWIADDGERYHLYYLRAPRELGDPELRHTAATIGHATSLDLTDWTVQGEALGPDPEGWDDLALWTGSVVRGDDGVWRMFYTAINSHRGHVLRDQRIGVAESDDLFTWRRPTDRPVVEPDGRWYKTLDEDPSASETWRDPFVFRDPDGDGWRMLITARARGAAPTTTACSPRRAATTCSTGKSVRRCASPARASASSRSPRCGSSTAARCSSSPATPRSRRLRVSSGPARTRRGRCWATP